MRHPFFFYSSENPLLYPREQGEEEGSVQHVPMPREAEKCAQNKGQDEDGDQSAENTARKSQHLIHRPNEGQFRQPAHHGDHDGERQKGQGKEQNKAQNRGHHLGDSPRNTP